MDLICIGSRLVRLTELLSQRSAKKWAGRNGRARDREKRTGAVLRSGDSTDSPSRFGSALLSATGLSCDLYLELPRYKRDVVSLT